MPGKEERGPNAHQSTDLHCTSIIPGSCPLPNAAARWARARVRSGQSSSPSCASGCQDSRGESAALQTAQPWGHQHLLGTPQAGVSWKPYQALRYGRALPGQGSRRAQPGLGAWALPQPHRLNYICTPQGGSLLPLQDPKSPFPVMGGMFERRFQHWS